MSTPAQVAANQANAQHSTGPKTDQGEAASCLNNFRHGLAGGFSVLPSEDQLQYDALLEGLRQEHQPSTITEQMLVEKMAQHFWLSQRAQNLADLSMDPDIPNVDHEKQFSLFLRYQTTNDRAFHKCLDQLLRLRAEKRKARLDEAALSQRAEDSKKAFESQKSREAAETRKQELHEARVRLLNAKSADQELDTEIRSMIEARLPGHTPIPFNTLKTVLAVPSKMSPAP
jgi:hypothetical protein